MKTSKEMADAVLKKRDAIEAQRIKRNIIIKRSVILSAAACVTGFIVLNSGKFSPEKPDIHNAVLENTVTDTVKPEEPKAEVTEAASYTDNEDNNGKIDTYSPDVNVTEDTEKADNNEITSYASPEKTPQTKEIIKTPLPLPSVMPETGTNNEGTDTVPAPSVLPSPSVSESHSPDRNVIPKEPVKAEEPEHVTESEIPEILPSPVPEKNQQESVDVREHHSDDTQVKEDDTIPSSSEGISCSEKIPAESPTTVPCSEPAAVPETETKETVVPVTAYTKAETLTGEEYHAVFKTVPPEDTGDPAGSVKASGNYNGEECMCEAEAYQITGRSESEALAVKFDENEEYYLFVRETNEQ